MRAATHPGTESAHISGQYAIVPSPLGTAERIVTNPVIKLMAGVIMALLTVIGSIMLAYITLTISTMDGRLNSQDATNVVQAGEIRELQDWKLAQSSGADTRKEYTEFLKSSQAQGAEFVDLVRDIRDRLPEPRRK